MRFPVVLFDLDGTVIDSGAIILASMKHAAETVLGAAPSDRELMASVGGPGLEAQMRTLDPDRTTMVPPVAGSRSAARAVPRTPKSTAAAIVAAVHRPATIGYSTVTDFARFLGWSTFAPRLTAM